MPDLTKISKEQIKKDRYQLILLRKVLSGVAYDLAIREAKKEAKEETE